MLAGHVQVAEVAHKVEFALGCWNMNRLLLKKKKSVIGNIPGD